MPSIDPWEYHAPPTRHDVPSVKNFSSKKKRKKKVLSVLCDKFLLLLDYETDKEY